MSLPQADSIEILARPVASAAGLEVRRVQLLAHRLPLTIQVFVQRIDGGDVSLEQCAALSGPLGDALEAAELLTQAYVLEISSPGIGEELHSERDFNSFRGFPVEVLQRPPQGGDRLRQGLLLGRDPQQLLLNDRGRTVRIPRSEVVRVRLITPQDDS